jgi:hypothetical protein
MHKRQGVGKSFAMMGPAANQRHGRWEHLFQQHPNGIVELALFASWQFFNAQRIFFPQT